MTITLHKRRVALHVVMMAGRRESWRDVVLRIARALAPRGALLLGCEECERYARAYIAIVRDDDVTTPLGVRIVVRGFTCDWVRAAITCRADAVEVIRQRLQPLCWPLAEIEVFEEGE